MENLTDFLFYKFMGIDLFHASLCMLFFLVLVRQRERFRDFLINFLHKLTPGRYLSLGDEIIKELTPPFDILYLAVVLWVAVYILGSANFFSFINSLERIFFIFLITWVIFKGVNVIISLIQKINTVRETKIDNYIIIFAGKSIKAIVVTVGSIMALQECGYNVTSIIAGLGIGGLAFALASKDFVANIFGFFTIFMDKPFTVGDYIATTDVEGTVEDIWLRCTKVRTADESLLTIPNSLLATKPVINKSKMRKRKITFKLGLTCSFKAEQIDKLCRKIKNMLILHPGIDNDTILVYFTEFGESSNNIFLFCFTMTNVWKEYLEIQHDINLKIMNILEDMGLTLAYPSRNISLENLPQEIPPISVIIQEPDREEEEVMSGGKR